jgi:sugar lactone lactonase YvrE
VDLQFQVSIQLPALMKMECEHVLSGVGASPGLAFDRAGNLYVAASLRGRRGIVRISPDGADAQLVVSGMNVVGLAFGPAGEMVVATNEAVYTIPLGIHGALLD